MLCLSFLRSEETDEIIGWAGTGCFVSSTAHTFMDVLGGKNGFLNGEFKCSSFTIREDVLALWISKRRKFVIFEAWAERARIPNIVSVTYKSLQFVRMNSATKLYTFNYRDLLTGSQSIAGNIVEDCRIDVNYSFLLKSSFLSITERQESTWFTIQRRHEGLQILIRDAVLPETVTFIHIKVQRMPGVWTKKYKQKFKKYLWFPTLCFASKMKTKKSIPHSNP